MRNAFFIFIMLLLAMTACSKADPPIQTTAGIADISALGYVHSPPITATAEEGINPEFLNHYMIATTDAAGMEPRAGNLALANNNFIIDVTADSRVQEAMRKEIFYETFTGKALELLEANKACV